MKKTDFILPITLILGIAAVAIYLQITAGRNKEFSILSFNPTANYPFTNQTKLINVDLTNAVDSGIVVPTKAQTPGGYFKFTTTIKADKPGTYYYKIYYQNESYKMPETRNGEYDTLAAENFYGSWEDTTVGFKTYTIKAAGRYNIADSFRIVGNPRNEQKYFGKQMQITETDIINMMDYIRSQPDWMKYIKTSMEEKKITEEEALRGDALWSLKSQRHKGPQNHRWKRNPRMGSYNAMLIIANEKEYANLPGYITHIEKKGPKGYFVNPFYYFNTKAYIEGVKRIVVKNFITLKTTLEPNKGVYVEQLDYTGKPDTSYYSTICGCNTNLYHTAHFEQFFHSINKDFVLNTIPVIEDVENNAYTREDFFNAEKKYKAGDFIKNYIRITDSPCKTVISKGNYIEIHTPGNTQLQNARKENVGIKTRHGFSYGKVTAKIKFPALVNSSNLWTGITQAVWLLFQDKEPWNNRRDAVKGYTPKGSHTADAPHIKTTYYSEIDFEILKASEQWPGTDNKQTIAKARQSNDIVITTTNWDLANPDPVEYFGAKKTIPYKNGKFEALRWDAYYQALTIRKAIKQSQVLLHPFYYYQIEWKPTEIIWRVGPSKDKMVVVGYMNDKYTSIPNNQMILVITQEYHLSDWWPPVVYNQSYIPFPKNDMIGKVYEVEVE